MNRIRVMFSLTLLVLAASLASAGSFGPRSAATCSADASTCSMDMSACPAGGPENCPDCCPGSCDAASATVAAR